jgi:homoserine dehydrogenase
VVKLLRTNEARLATVLGRPLELVAVSARTKSKKRSVGLEGITWIDDPRTLARHPGIDVFVELMGEANGLAKAAVEAAIAAGKHVVTANKALLARHGREFALLAEKHQVTLSFEAAVAGGIPVIKTIREALIGNEIVRVYGILNGTCNFILTQMQEQGRPFEEVLAEAQALGYAEADPTFDIGGHDTAHKLAILTSLAFATDIAFDEIPREGIQAITPADIEAADDLGYRIKLLGVALRTHGGIEARIHPAMVPKHSAIAEVSGVTNAVAIEGDFVGNLLLVGAGAGAKPTASAVVSDIADIALHKHSVFPFVVPAGSLKPYTRAKSGLHQDAYYVRMAVYDRPGAMAAIASRMGEQEISIESIVQRRPRSALPGIGARLAPGELAPLVMITHDTTEAAVRRALAAIEADGKVAGKPQMIRIEKL